MRIDERLVRWWREVDEGMEREDATPVARRVLTVHISRDYAAFEHLYSRLLVI